jgi:hypothetical protein
MIAQRISVLTSWIATELSKPKSERSRELPVWIASRSRLKQWQKELGCLHG